MSFKHIPRGRAKPFTHLVRVGVDVCHIPRIEKLVERYTKAERGGYLVQWLERCFRHEELQELQNWMSRRKSLPLGLRQQQLAQHLAGWWAAKEAAIKAHHKRRLFPKDVWVRRTQQGRPEILIAPPQCEVGFTAEIAALRGLNEHMQRVRGASYSKSADVPWIRWRDPGEEEFQLADGSISHDGPCAFATVQAIDEDLKPDSRTLDHGLGPPIHTLLPGDRGFWEALPPSLVKSFIKGTVSEAPD